MSRDELSDYEKLAHDIVCSALSQSKPKAAESWVDAQAKLAQAERMLNGAAKLTREAAEIMERVNAEIPVHPVKESETERKRGGMYNEQPLVQLQPRNNSTVPFEQPETREGD